MSTGQPDQTAVKLSPQPSVPGDGAPNDGHRDERSLVKLYMDLTDECESNARNVLMFVSRGNEESKTRRPD